MPIFLLDLVVFTIEWEEICLAPMLLVATVSQRWLYDGVGECF